MEPADHLGSGWEGPARRRRRGPAAALAVVAVVVLAALLVRPGAPTRDPDGGLTIAPSPPVPSSAPARPDPQVAQRGGTWTTIGARPDIDLLRPGTAVWTGQELLVGFTPRVSAYDPDRPPARAWRSLPPHPAGALQVRGAALVRPATSSEDAPPAAAVHVYGAKRCAGCDWTPQLWGLDPAFDRWVPLADAPDPVQAASARAEHVVTAAGLLVVVRDLGADGIRVLAFDPRSLADPAVPGWEDLQVPSLRDADLQAVGAGDHLVLVGTATTLDGARHTGALLWSRADGWQAITAGLPMAAPQSAAAVWTGDQVVLFGGVPVHPGGSRGAALSPSTRRWTPLPPLPDGDPALPDLDRRAGPLEGVTGVWDGQRAVFVGGLEPLHAGWSPDERSWQVRWPPAPRAGAATAWTGQQLLLWAGVDRRGPVIDLAAWPARRTPSDPPTTRDAGSAPPTG